uniref:DNA-(apurinic or apyrimidinic site) endonuclease n=1 Tax=Globisporangium ultimum (strain ATCC 200006 / CBS 805.95 / DAOM BR144) TaxID=431595 RepID=K3WK17_GLOUD
MRTTEAPTVVRPLRLLTWNVNGLRAVLQRGESRKTLRQFLDALDADVICFQETKLTRSELDEELVRPEGYDAFYSFCRVRSGYSGVVTFCKSDVPTLNAEEGLTGQWKTANAVGCVGELHHEACILFELTLVFGTKLVNELESEGRCVITDHGAFVLLNLYCPATRNMERLEYKLAFHRLVQDRVYALHAAKRRVIVVGDINIAHKEIDHCDPSPTEGIAFADHPCRKWMDEVVVGHEGSSEKHANAARTSGGKLVDAFRYYHPHEARAYTCWNMVTAARQTNYGTRIDYILVDHTLMEDAVTDCRLLELISQQSFLWRSIQPDRLGSDHCPVLLTAVVQLPIASETTKLPALCAKNFAEFAGKQQAIKSFFSAPTRVESPHKASTTSPSQSSPSSSSSKFASPSLKKRHSMTQTRASASRKLNQQSSIKSFFAQSSAVVSSSKVLPNPGRPHEKDKDVIEREEREFASVVRDFETKHNAAQDRLRAWKQVLSGQPPKTPLCHCQQPTVLRTVLKTNDNWGRKFYVCTKPAGEKGNPDARCEFFQWVDDKSSKRVKTTR